MVWIIVGCGMPVFLIYTFTKIHRKSWIVEVSNMEEKITCFSAKVSLTVDLHIISQLLVNHQFN